MLASLELLHVLQQQDIRFYVSFPDKWLVPLLQILESDPTVTHLPATIEREALGLAVGAQLAGMRSALVMQNSGIGNLLNDWASLAHNYALPVPWIVSDRGSTGEQVTTQMIWHSRLRAVLEAVQIPTRTFPSPDHIPELYAFLHHGYTTHQCVAALFPHSFWQDDLAHYAVNTHTARVVLPHVTQQCVRAETTVRHTRAPWRRYEVLASLLELLTDEFLFVTLGDPCKEVFALHDRAENFYMLGSMGLVLPLGLGFAQARARMGGQRKTVVIDGDGSQLMQMGSLGTLAREQPDLALIVIDNASYGSTGGQATLTRTHVDLEGIARAFGLTNTATTGHPKAFAERLHIVLSTSGPSVTVVPVQPGAPSTPLIPLSPGTIALRFQEAVASTERLLVGATT
jgi:sulfopyruvate decarboxylase alpha subunit